MGQGDEGRCQLVFKNWLMNIYLVSIWYLVTARYCCSSARIRGYTARLGLHILGPGFWGYMGRGCNKCKAGEVLSKWYYSTD